VVNQTHKCCLDPFLKRPLITEDLFCSFFIFKTSNNCEPLKTDIFCQIIGFENLNVFVIKRCDIAIIEVESCPFLNCFVFDSDRKPKAGVLGSISSGLTFQDLTSWSKHIFWIYAYKSALGKWPFIAFTSISDIFSFFTSF